MTNSINYRQQIPPAYSGVTINITNPSMYTGPMHNNCPPDCAMHNVNQPAMTFANPVAQNDFPNGNYINYPQNSFYQTPLLPEAPQYSANHLTPNGYNIGANYTTLSSGVNDTSHRNVQREIPPKDAGVNSSSGNAVSYPPQYYLNNYNYIQNGENNKNQLHEAGQMPAKVQNMTQQPFSVNAVEEKIDMTPSEEIIKDINDRVAEQKELEKNGKKTKIVALTNEYIMSLENYLNNPNSEIRLMASKEVLQRLNEDRDRFDDAALNALLNKMLQDPNKLIRLAALSAFSSQLASGNEYTVQLLTNIQNNPNADKEDVLQAANILLKMSSSTEVRYTKVPPKEKTNDTNKELEASQKQVEQLRNQLQKYKEKEIEQMLQLPQGK